MANRFIILLVTVNLQFYDKFYKVRDKYESYIDTTTMQPYKFIRNVYEGGYKTYEKI